MVNSIVRVYYILAPFCPYVLSVTESEVFKFPGITVDLSVHPFCSFVSEMAPGVRPVESDWTLVQQPQYLSFG